MKTAWIFLVYIYSILREVLGSYSCGRKLFTGTAGTISTPNYGGRSNQTVSCTYEIEVSGRWVILNWEGFDVGGTMPDCYNNYVSVSIGCYPNKKYLSRFCSKNADKPHEIYAKDGCIEIKYRESSYGYKGFRASYTSYSMRSAKSTSRCWSDRNLYSNQGVVVSPGWPVGYKPSYFPILSSECEWDLKVSSSRKIKLNFMDVDLYVSGSSCSSYRTDTLKVKGKKSSVTTNKGTRTYCRKNPFSLSTDYYEMELEFDASSLYNRNNRGFVVGYVSYVDKVAAKNSKIGMIVGAVIAVMCVGIAIFCCVRVYKRKQAGAGGYVHSAPQTTTVTTTTTTHPPPPEGGFQQPYPGQPTQPYYPPQQGYGHAAYPPVDDKQSGYPQMEPPPSYPGPPTSGYPPPPAQPYPGQPGAAPYPGQPGATAYPPPAEAQPFPGAQPYPGTQSYPPGNAPYSPAGTAYHGVNPPYTPPEAVDMQKPSAPH